MLASQVYRVFWTLFHAAEERNLVAPTAAIVTAAAA